MKDALGHGSNVRGGAVAAPAASPVSHQSGIFAAVKRFGSDTSGSGKDLSGAVMKLGGADPDALAEGINEAFEFGHLLG